MNLVEFLSEIDDPRRLQGQRYGSVAILLIIIMGILRGQYGYREIGRFGKLNQSILVDQFEFKNQKVPSHVPIRAFIVGADFVSLQKAFHKWTQDYAQIDEGEWISIDGKSIRSTVSDCSNEFQNFVCLVSLFSSKREQVLHVEKLETQKDYEGKTVEDLFEILDLKNVVFSLDALHCKKNATYSRIDFKSAFNVIKQLCKYYLLSIPHFNLKVYHL